MYIFLSNGRFLCVKGGQDTEDIAVALMLLRVGLWGGGNREWPQKEGRHLH